MNCQCKCWSVKFVVIPHYRFTCNAVVWIWSSSSKIKGKIQGQRTQISLFYGKHGKKPLFAEKSEKRFGSRVFDIGRSSYTKHEYFFLRKMGSATSLSQITVDWKVCSFCLEVLKTLIYIFFHMSLFTGELRNCVSIGLSKVPVQMTSSS